MVEIKESSYTRLTKIAERFNKENKERMFVVASGKVKIFETKGFFCLSHITIALEERWNNELNKVEGKWETWEFDRTFIGYAKIKEICSKAEKYLGEITIYR